MIAVSNDFKTAMKQPVKELQAYLGDIKSEDDLISFKISCESGMCKTAMRKLEGKYTGEHNLLGQWVHVGFGVKLANGTFEYLDYGSFLVTEITTVKDTGVTTIIGYDKMINSMTTYQPLEIEYPMGLYDYTKKLCEACNLELLNDTFSDSKAIEWNGDITNLNPTMTVIDGDLYKVSDMIPTKDELANQSIYVTTIDGDIEEIPAEDYIIADINDDAYLVNAYGLIMLVVVKKSTVMDGIAFSSGTYFLYLNQNDNLGYVSKLTLNSNGINNWLINGELWENIEGITYRDIFVQIAQVTGTTCIISDDKVYFKPLTDTGETLTYDNMFKLKLEPKYGEINSVVLSRTPQEDNIYMRDEESIKNNGLTEFKIENNEIIDKDRDNAMTPIYNALKGTSYYPFESTTEGLGWYEIGDKLDIINDTGDVFNTTLFNLNITVDGSIKEILKTVADTKTQTQYQYATTIGKRVKNTELMVNKQEQYIKSLVSDVYEENGVVNQKFSEIYQNIEGIVNSVQNSGGGNLIKNSVMFAYDNDNKPNDWEMSNVGVLNISSNVESLSAGCLSGHSFTLQNEIAKQKVYVNTDSNYSFTTKIKKGLDGYAKVRIYNSNEEYLIEVAEGEEAFYKEYEIKLTAPKDNYYMVEFYGSADSDATFTDNMLALGDYKSQWTQANGEIMNTQVNVNVNGVLVKSSVYLGDYTVMSPLEFAGYSNINGIITRVFSLNKDVTEVEKLLARKEIKMTPIKVVPITTGDLQGWAFVPSVEEV